MKLKHVHEFKKMISHFNYENAWRDVRYEIEISKFAPHSYSVELKFKNLIYSPDMAELMRWCIDSDVCFMACHFSDFTCLHFQ